MKTVKGYEYTVDGFEDLNKFALGILALINAKSSRQGTVVDVKTYEGLNMVKVVSLIDIDSELTSLLGKITRKDSIDIIHVEFEDIKDEGQKLISDKEFNQEDGIFLVIESE